MDLTTKYMGLSLKNPLIASPSPLSHNLKHIKELANSGVAAIVIHSLFEEQLFEEEHNSETTHEIGHCSPLDKGEYRDGRRKQKEGSQTI
jgi:dihydroorotate dehydrogenase